MVLGLIMYRFTLRFLGGKGTDATPLYQEPARQKTYLRHSWQALWVGIAIIIVLVALGYTGMIVYNPVAISVWASVAILVAGLGFMAWVYVFGKLNSAERRRSSR